MDQNVTVTNSAGKSIAVIKGRRYYKAGGKANIRAESPTAIVYENRRGEESRKSAEFFVRYYTEAGYNSPFEFGS